MTEPLDIRRKRLLFRSWHRGTKEADLLMGSFAERHVASFSAEQLDRYEAWQRQQKPTSQQLQSKNSLSKSGTLEIIPMQSALTLFIWSKNRIIPVRLTDFSITEEAFDPALNPIRAKVSLGMRVLSVNDLGFEHRGSSLFMSYLSTKQALAAQATGGVLGAFGLEALP